MASAIETGRESTAPPVLTLAFEFLEVNSAYESEEARLHCESRRGGGAVGVDVVGDAGLTTGPDGLTVRGQRTDTET